MNRFLENDLYLKIFALFLAVIIWFYVVNEQTPRIERSVTVKLEVRNLVKGLVVTEVPFGAEIRVSGLRSNILALEDKDIKAYVDVQGIKEGEYFLPVKTQFPRQIELLEVKPDRIKIDLEKIIGRRVPVKAKIKGHSPGEYAVIGAMPQEKEVSVTGPRSKVEEVAVVWAVVHLNQTEGKNTARGELLPVNSKGQNVKGVKVEPQFTTVTIPTLPVQEITVRARLKGLLAPGFVIKRVTIVPRALRVAASSEKLAQLPALDTENIDLTGLDSNLEKEVVVTVPEGVTLVEGKKVKILVVVGIIQESRVFSDLPVAVLNLREGWQAKINPEKVKVTVQGSRNLLKKLNLGEIQVSIDAAGLEKEGEFKLTALVNLPQGLNLEKVEPPEITLNLLKKND